MRCRQHPLGADQRAAAQVLVQRVDERHLPTPFGRVRVFSADHSGRPRPGSSLHAAHVFAVRGRLGRHGGIGRGQRGHRGISRIVNCVSRKKNRLLLHTRAIFIRVCVYRFRLRFRVDAGRGLRNEVHTFDCRLSSRGVYNV